jgi:hypothetical protein
MPRLRIDLKPEAYEALAAKAIEERRPVDWQAEVLIESGLGLRDRPHQRRSRSPHVQPDDSRPSQEADRVLA